ncbi:MAG TPA: pyridoxal 5'-phosphate synthase glutaminase subunit PdxT [Acidimicrobiales bacterium]|nr:pyridoxal 5'-phosphate synthase glutaminase subunit PdxT [Acidimicrobiales bacterium]
MSEPTIGVLGLQGDVREHLLALERVGVTGVNVRSPKALSEVDALILPGGESTTLGMLLISSGLDGPLRERLSAKMPAFGTCAGMILLSRTVLDGREDQHPLGAINIAVRRNAFGRQVESFEVDLDVEGLKEPMHAVFIRAPIVESHGERVRVLSSITHNGDLRPVVCREENIMVASFHPELTSDVRLHRLFLDIVRESTG